MDCPSCKRSNGQHDADYETYVNSCLSSITFKKKNKKKGKLMKDLKSTKSR